MTSTIEQDAVLDADTLALLQGSLERYGRERYGFEQRRALLGVQPGFSREAWDDYAQFGWLGIALAPDDGGFAGAPAAVATLMGYAGASLALEPLLASAVLCGRALAACGSEQAAAERLQALAAGEAIGAFAHAEGAHDALGGGDADAPLSTRARDGQLSGTKPLVLHGDAADFLVVGACDERGQTALYLVDGAQPGVQRTPLRLADGRGAASIAFDAAAAQCIASGAKAAALLAALRDDARLALAAEAYGALRALNAHTLAYLKERRQFGRAIGSNQALQHRMVELYMLQEEGRAVLGAACSAPAGERAQAVLAAAAHLHAAARHAAHEAVQIHGGIGITEELGVSHYFRRILVVQRLLGERDQMLRGMG